MKITKFILRVQVGFNWFLSQHGFIALVYNNGDQNVLINDWYRYACFKVLSEHLVWKAYLNILGYKLVITLFPLIHPHTEIEGVRI